MATWQGEDAASEGVSYWGRVPSDTSGAKTTGAIEAAERRQASSAASEQNGATGRHVDPHHCHPSERSLASLIEAEVLPRLLLAHGLGRRDDAERSEAAAQTGIDPSAFARACLTHTAAELMSAVERALGARYERQSVLLETLGPAAAALGEMWERDECSFTDVTLGIGRLHEVMRRLRGRGSVEGRADRSIFLAPTPGEQHTFGLVIVEDFFMQAGWRVDCEIGPSADDICEAVACEKYDVAGFTLSKESQSPSLQDVVRGVRERSANPGITILVGGRVFADEPKLAEFVGADVAASDAGQAVRIVEDAMPRQRSQSD